MARAGSDLPRPAARARWGLRGPARPWGCPPGPGCRVSRWVGWSRGRWLCRLRSAARGSRSDGRGSTRAARAVRPNRAEQPGTEVRPYRGAGGRPGGAGPRRTSRSRLRCWLRFHCVRAQSEHDLFIIIVAKNTQPTSCRSRCFSGRSAVALGTFTLLCKPPPAPPPRDFLTFPHQALHPGDTGSPASPAPSTRPSPVSRRVFARLSPV